jgi:hypothetical protein
MKNILLVLIIAIAGTAYSAPPVNNPPRINIWHPQAAKPKRWVYAFVADIRNIPKQEALRYHKLMEQGVFIQVFDIDFDEKAAKKFGVTSAPYFVVMQLNPGFNDGMFNTPYVVQRTDKLEDIEQWVDWLRNDNRSRYPRL